MQIVCSRPLLSVGVAGTRCWFYRNGAHGKNFSCSARSGKFTSGRKKAALAALGSSAGGSTDVYTAYENATVKQSDGFAYYPSVAALSGLLAARECI